MTTIQATTPDLIVLSLLAHWPMHGYQLFSELVKRDVHDWADISKPQVYYSLKKLAQAGLIADVQEGGQSLGPRKAVYKATAKGKRVLREGLKGDGWATRRAFSPFTTWLVLCLNAEAATRHAVIERRRRFLHDEIQREEATLQGLHHEQFYGGVTIARKVVELTIKQFASELAWLDELEETLGEIAVE